MSLNWLRAAALCAAAGLSLGSAHAGIIDTLSFSGSGPDGKGSTITVSGNIQAVDDVGGVMDGVADFLKWNIQVNGGAGDIRGFFMDINPFSVAGLSITGANVTEVQISENNVSNLGNGANMNSVAPFDIGVEIGTSGASPDFISATMFNENGVLALSQFFNQRWGFRSTSTGPNQQGSVKITGTFGPEPDPKSDADVPEPGTMVLLGLGLIGLGARARRRKA